MAAALVALGRHESASQFVERGLVADPADTSTKLLVKLKEDLSKLDKENVSKATEPTESKPTNVASKGVFIQPTDDDNYDDGAGYESDFSTDTIDADNLYVVDFSDEEATTPPTSKTRVSNDEDPPASTTGTTTSAP